MHVNIFGNLFEYNSDFDPIDIFGNTKKGWKVSAGEYFKFPVKLGSTYCFIKRFEKKSEDISGYELLVKIKGIKQRGLPLVYDIVSTKEANKYIYYLFTEYLVGNTLDNLQGVGFSFKPSKMAEDLFFAFKSIHENGFWLPDFDPKNLYLTTSGDFFVIDLDSVYRLSILPNPAMWGSQDYWLPVHDFYRKFSGFTPSETKLIRGDVLNNLCLVYLFALYSNYLLGEGLNLSSDSISKLNGIFTSKCKLFTATLNFCFIKQPNTAEINQKVLPYNVFSSLIKNCFFPDDDEYLLSTSSKNMKPVNAKVKFNVVGYRSRLLKGENYTLEWQTYNVTSLSIDNIKENIKGYKNFTAEKNCVHTLKAIYKNNQSITSKINIEVAAIPQIELKANLSDIEIGTSIKIEWKINHGKNSQLYQDDNLIQKDCPTEGSKFIVLNISDKKLESENVRFIIYTENEFGDLYESGPLTIIVKKKKSGCSTIIVWAIIILVILWLIAQFSSSFR